MSRYLWLLDNGHGGVIDGLYQTEGKRSPQWANGSMLYEGEFNRAIVNRLIEMMTAARIHYVNIVPEMEDVSLNERVRRANSYHAQRECIYVSIHSNAGGGKGYEIYTSPGETKSDKVATVFFDEFKKVFPDAKMRADLSDGDVDKEANFYVLKNTNMPAILSENFFMDNEEECCKCLMTRDGRDRIALAHFNAIQQIEKNGLGAIMPRMAAVRAKSSRKATTTPAKTARTKTSRAKAATTKKAGRRKSTLKKG